MRGGTFIILFLMSGGLQVTGESGNKNACDALM